MEVKSRKQALLDGDKYYFTGKPCKSGHLCKRHISAGCYECTLIYQKAYRHANPDRWSAKNSKWNESNRIRKRESDKVYREARKGRRKALRSLYKTKKRQASVISVSEWDIFVIEECQDLITVRNQETKIDWHIDHMLPLNSKKVCGLHCGDNLQVIPAQMNLEKGNKLWYTERYQFAQ